MQTRQVLFLWHMHQPYYGLPNRDTSFLPWVRLHSVKSYYDVARTLEAHPDVHSTVNFSGSLLKQLHEYVTLGQRDTWWDLTLKPAGSLSDAEKRHLVKHFFSVDWDHCVRRYPRYAELLEARERGTALEQFTDRDWTDLQVYFNLAWVGFSVRAESEIVQGLIAKAHDFSESDKVALLEEHMRFMGLIPGLYRRLAESGQVEISVTPMYHPILPLLIDTDAAARATPDRPRPARFQALEDAHYHVRAAKEIAQTFFGVSPQGMWPAEGSVSPEAVEVFRKEGVSWIASDEDVLRISRGDRWRRQDITHPWKLGDGPAMFFRDHGLSDQIGFVYSKNPARQAAQDFLARVRSVPSDDMGIVPVILDGENPWEHYPDDAKAFMNALCEALRDAPDITTTTPSKVLATVQPSSLERLHSGSWILANYQIWIGHPEENRGWELLKRTREDLLAVTDTLSESSRAAAWEGLYSAEGSDWFWWYGDDFNTENDADFDRLFRENLKSVYWSMGQEPPMELDVPINGSQTSNDVFTPQTALISPKITGKSDFFYEWTHAGVYVNTGARGSMFDNTRVVDRILLGFDHSYLYVRIEPAPEVSKGLDDCDVRLIVSDVTLDIRESVSIQGDPVADARVVRSGAIELRVPVEATHSHPGQDVQVQVVLQRAGMEIERHPSDHRLSLQRPGEDFEGRNWMV